MLNGSLPFAFTIPLKSSKGTNANNNPNMISTKVDMAKNVIIIFLESASRIVKFEIVKIFSISIFLFR